MGKKNIGKFYPVGVLVLIFIFFYFTGKENDNNFFSAKINSKIKTRNNWQIRATEFYLENGLRIDSTISNSIQLKIGDSIAKKANTWSFEVFRKDVIGRYEFNKRYNYSIR